MSDDDLTPPRGKPRPITWSDGHALDSQRQRRDAMTGPRGVPTVRASSVPVHDLDRDTSPLDLLLAEEVEPEEHKAVDRLRRDSRDPYDLAFNLAKAMVRRKAEDKSGNAALQMQLVDSFAAVKDDVTNLKRDRKIVMGVGGAILVAALGSLGVGLGALWSRAEHEGETTIRLQRLEQDVQLLLHEQRHPSPAPSWAHDPDKDKP